MHTYNLNENKKEKHIRISICLYKQKLVINNIFQKNILIVYLIYISTIINKFPYYNTLSIK